MTVRSKLILVEKVENSEGRKFILVTETKEWAEAETHCQSKGGHLASVLTEEVKTLIGDSFNCYVWLGGRGYRIVMVGVGQTGQTGSKQVRAPSRGQNNVC